MPTVCHDTLVQPATLQEALTVLAQRPAGSIKPLAGATDLFANRAIPAHLLDLSRITCLREAYIVHAHAAYLRLGSAFTWGQCQDGRLEKLVGPHAGLEALQLAAREIGGQQVQQQGTLVGNLCNASPAADGVPVLLSLGAQVECVSVRGHRVIPLEDFILAPRRIALAPDELVTALRLPLGPVHWRCVSHFQKLGSRASLLISIAMCAVWLACEQKAGRNRIVAARIAVGSCSPVARRFPLLEAQLLGREPAAALTWLEQGEWKSELAVLSPVEDIRATATYRRHAAGVLVYRSLSHALEAFL